MTTVFNPSSWREVQICQLPTQHSPSFYVGPHDLRFGAVEGNPIKPASLGSVDNLQKSISANITPSGAVSVAAGKSVSSGSNPFLAQNSPRKPPSEKHWFRRENSKKASIEKLLEEKKTAEPTKESEEKKNDTQVSIEAEKKSDKKTDTAITNPAEKKFDEASDASSAKGDEKAEERRRPHESWIGMDNFKIRKRKSRRPNRPPKSKCTAKNPYIAFVNPRYKTKTLDQLQENIVRKYSKTRNGRLSNKPVVREKEISGWTSQYRPFQTDYSAWAERVAQFCKKHGKEPVFDFDDCLVDNRKMDIQRVVLRPHMASLLCALESENVKCHVMSYNDALGGGGEQRIRWVLRQYLSSNNVGTVVALFPALWQYFLYPSPIQNSKEFHAAVVLSENPKKEAGDFVFFDDRLDHCQDIKAKGFHSVHTIVDPNFQNVTVKMEYI